MYIYDNLARDIWHKQLQSLHHRLVTRNTNTPHTHTHALYKVQFVTALHVTQTTLAQTKILLSTILLCYF